MIIALVISIIITLLSYTLCLFSYYSMLDEDELPNSFVAMYIYKRIRSNKILYKLINVHPILYILLFGLGVFILMVIGCIAIFK